jgi:hypothetical protein
MKLPPIRKTWSTLMAIMAWLSGAICAFITFPIQLSLESRLDLLIVGFSQFSGAALLALLVIYCRRPDSQRRLPRIAGALLAVLFVLFFAYVGLQAEWTCEYAQRLIVKGGALSDVAAAHVARNPNLAQCAELIAEFGGNAAAVYGAAGLNLRFLALSLLYTLAWLVAVAIVVLVAVVLAQRPSGSKGAA